MEVELEGGFTQGYTSHQELPLFLSDVGHIEFHPKQQPAFSAIKEEQDQDHAFHDLLTHHLNPTNGSPPPLLMRNPCSEIDFDSVPPSFNNGCNGGGYFSGFDFFETKPFHANVSTMMDPPLENFHGLITNPLLYSSFVGPLAYRPPDEGSCTTVEINGGGGCKDGRGRVATRSAGGRGGKKQKSSAVVKGQWTIEEDRMLIELVESYGLRKWSQVAPMLNGRSGKQCRERWHNHLRPNIKKDIWSEEEDKILIAAHGEIGNKWAEIAKRLPGRTENSIKNHWNATKRRQFCRRKCRSKYPKQSSLLQDYIKGLDLHVINAGCRKKSTAITIPADVGGGDQEYCNDDDDEEEEEDVDFMSDVVPEFSFEAAGLFDQETDGIDSLFEEMSSYSGGGAVSACWMEAHEVKKELDLVEMINQVNL